MTDADWEQAGQRTSSNRPHADRFRLGSARPRRRELHRHARCGDPRATNERADNLLFRGNLLICVVEAKNAGVALSSVEAPPVAHNPYLAPEFSNLVVVEECHRSIYALSPQVLEYFDASLVGLTSTTAKYTYAFFHKNVVSEYTHTHVARDGVNVPRQTPDGRWPEPDELACKIAEDLRSTLERIGVLLHDVGSAA